MIKNKKKLRIKRALKTRMQIIRLKSYRFFIHKTNLHIYASIVDPTRGILTTASSLELEIRKKILEYKKKMFLNKKINSYIAQLVGCRIAKKSLKIGIKKVVFDRSGYKYHGNIKILANFARKAGLKF